MPASAVVKNFDVIQHIRIDPRTAATTRVANQLVYKKVEPVIHLRLVPAINPCKPDALPVRFSPVNASAFNLGAQLRLPRNLAINNLFKNNRHLSW